MRNYCVCMRNFPRTAVLKKIHINCKLKLQSKGCLKKIGGGGGGGVSVVKFVQRLALDFPYTCL